MEMFRPCNYLPHSMFYLYVIFLLWLVYFREINSSFLVPASVLGPNHVVARLKQARAAQALTHTAEKAVRSTPEREI